MFAAKRLFITEKPAAGRNLVAGICLGLGVTEVNQATRQKDGYHRLSNGDAVIALRGHMIEPQFLSDAQKEAHRSTYFEFLPVVVKKFTNYKPKPDTDKNGKPLFEKDGKTPKPSPQYKVAVAMIKAAKEIVNAGDIDREGQLIVDELLQDCDVDPEERTKPIWRLPLVSAREDDIAKQVRSITERNSDKKWVQKRLAAYARSLYDAALGMNASMAYQSVTDYARMAIGRVQTPVINIVVERDEQIESFKPRNFYVPVITLRDGTQLRWFKREGSEGMPGFDEVGRIIDEGVARQMCNLIAGGQSGTITAAEARKKSEAPPLPHSASVLHAAVSKSTGMTLKEAEAAAQSLYQKHKAISYVGTDCRFLPTSLLEDARATVTALSKLYGKAAGGASLALRSAAWNDSRVDEHYAIVPTGTLPSGATAAEQSVFEIVSKRYLAQFYPAAESIVHQLQAKFGGDEFKATRTEVVRLGWKEVEGGDAEKGAAAGDAADVDDDVQVEDEVHEDREGSK